MTNLWGNDRQKNKNNSKGKGVSLPVGRRSRWMTFTKPGIFHSRIDSRRKYEGVAGVV
jgi:hypothetical protein